MAWEQVPDKLMQYSEIEYGGYEQAAKLLAEFNATILLDVPVHRRDEFEEQLDYRLGACKNLITSRAMNPKSMSP